MVDTGAEHDPEQRDRRRRPWLGKGGEKGRGPAVIAKRGRWRPDGRIPWIRRGIVVSRGAGGGGTRGEYDTRSRSCDAARERPDFNYGRELVVKI